ncbi:MAG TPA: hypothetical protein VHO43_03735, partial [Ignavibacteriales bacterium]|nr:hypothetical protein [Ignavibacteriales bacterium]
MDNRQEKDTKHSEDMRHRDHKTMHKEHEKDDKTQDNYWQEMADEHKKHHTKETQMKDHLHSGHDKKMEGHAKQGHDHHEMMIQDFKKRFWISLALTIPILIISPMIHHFLQLGGTLRFTGDSYLLFALSSIVYFYGGWPFLTGLVSELKNLKPGMMTLVAMAISVAYFYSSAVTFGLNGEIFFWELATLIDIMLLGHWLEMRSV